MKKLLNFLLLSGISLGVLGMVGCDSGQTKAAKEPRWDVQVCDRCKMILSDKYFSAQLTDKKENKRYYFDDLGCALNWITENNKTLSNLEIYATDAKNGSWLNLKDADIIKGFVTPMSYGIGVLEKGSVKEKDREKLSLEQAILEVTTIKEEKQKAKMH